MRQPLPAMAKLLLLVLFAVIIGVLLVILPTPAPLVHIYIALTSVYIVDKFLQLT